MERKRGAAAAMLTAGLGMGGPILLAGALGQASAGVAAALGGFMVGMGANARDLRPALLAAGGAMAAAWLLGGEGIRASMAAVLLSGFAALGSGYSRPAALVAGRFIVFLWICLGPLGGGAEEAARMVLVAAGAGWMAVLVLTLGDGPAPPAMTAPAATAVRKFRRWRATLGHAAGWNHALRLVPCLGMAAALELGWPGHHLRWVAVTVAILTQRQPEAAYGRAMQRAAGAVLGVAATGLLLGRGLPGWGLALLVGALAGVAAWLRSRSYLAYAAGMTPLVILLLDGGRPVTVEVLVERVVATLIGAGLVIAANRLARPP